ncbi:hypothetical protein SUGI_1227400 [Cryptomeria japonica]|uniref:Uncharacterized protein n=1 Tax=Cryptomeria japonica TaxID=3369 RepID=A0AAD3RPE8_CRYJA|nr:hypothetical protein SUGI_1227400 [Cryptomeria japonica]
MTFRLQVPLQFYGLPPRYTKVTASYGCPPFPGPFTGLFEVLWDILLWAVPTILWAIDDYIHPYGHMTTMPYGQFNGPGKGWGGIKGLLPAGWEGILLWGGAPTLELSPYYS